MDNVEDIEGFDIDTGKKKKKIYIYIYMFILFVVCINYSIVYLFA